MCSINTQRYNINNVNKRKISKRKKIFRKWIPVFSFFFDVVAASNHFQCLHVFKAYQRGISVRLHVYFYFIIHFNTWNVYLFSPFYCQLQNWVLSYATRIKKSKDEISKKWHPSQVLWFNCVSANLFMYVSYMKYVIGKKCKEGPRGFDYYYVFQEIYFLNVKF